MEQKVNLKIDKNMFKFPSDLFLIGFIFFILIGIFLLAINKDNSKGKNIEILENNRLKYKFSLLEDKVIEIDEILGKGTIEIKDGKVRKIKSSCPKHICINQNWVSKIGDSIICVPNKQVIRITGINENIDGILK